MAGVELVRDGNEDLSKSVGLHYDVIFYYVPRIIKHLQCDIMPRDFLSQYEVIFLVFISP